jgi:predicted metal-dependent phosphoesterase TrpH
MEDLISQLTAASQEQQTVVKEYQNVNETLTKEQEKKEKVIKELGNEFHKTKFASENSKVERGNSHSF